MNRVIIALLSIGAGLHVVACGGGGDTGGGGSSGGSEPSKPGAGTHDKTGQSTSPTDPAPSGTGSSTSASACVSAGDKGNAKGVGAFCDKTTHCGSLLLCTGDFGETPSFCTMLCSADADCGDGAQCYHDPRGAACVPTACLKK